jgi:hypothetical protein
MVLYIYIYIYVYIYSIQSFTLAKQVLYCLNHALQSIPFTLIILELWSWLAVVLLISASQVARIIGMSHWCLAGDRFILKVVLRKIQIMLDI